MPALLSVITCSCDGPSRRLASGCSSRAQSASESGHSSPHARQRVHLLGPSAGAFRVFRPARRSAVVQTREPVPPGCACSSACAVPRGVHGVGVTKAACTSPLHAFAWMRTVRSRKQFSPAIPDAILTQPTPCCPFDPVLPTCSSASPPQTAVQGCIAWPLRLAQRLTIPHSIHGNTRCTCTAAVLTTRSMPATNALLLPYAWPTPVAAMRICIELERRGAAGDTSWHTALLYVQASAATTRQASMRAAEPPAEALPEVDPAVIAMLCDQLAAAMQQQDSAATVSVFEGPMPGPSLLPRWLLQLLALVRHHQIHRLLQCPSPTHNWPARSDSSVHPSVVRGVLCAVSCMCPLMTTESWTPAQRLLTSCACMSTGSCARVVQGCVASRRRHLPCAEARQPRGVRAAARRPRRARVCAVLGFVDHAASGTPPGGVGGSEPLAAARHPPAAPVRPAIFSAVAAVPGAIIPHTMIKHPRCLDAVA